MSATIDFTTVTNSIAALSISGVTVKDSDELTNALGGMFAMLVPVPDNFITGLRVVTVSSNKVNLDVHYDLHYRYFHCKPGVNSLFSDYQNLLTNLAAITVAFSQNESLSGAIDNGAPTYGPIGTLQDNAGNVYLGCDLTIHVFQFLEV
jgi:hypothetical protein